MLRQIFSVSFSLSLLSSLLFFTFMHMCSLPPALSQSAGWLGWVGFLIEKNQSKKRHL